jgi:hypothetical protein
MRKEKVDVKKNKCGKSTFPDKETSDKYIEIKREKIGVKFQELRSYKCLECKQWHHTSNMTPILARQVEELTLEVLSLQAEIKSKNEILDSIKNTLLSIYPVQRADEVVKLKKQLAQKEKEMAEFKKVLQDVIKTNK